jgi:excisionase family DNA binding protein
MCTTDTNRTHSTPATVRDLCEVTGLSRPTVCAAVRTGELPGYKIGERYVIPRDAFDAFCRGEWVPQVRPIFTERIKPLAPDALITKRMIKKDKPS